MKLILFFTYFLITKRINEQGFLVKFSYIHSYWTTLYALISGNLLKASEPYLFFMDGHSNFKRQPYLEASRTSQKKPLHQPLQFTRNISTLFSCFRKIVEKGGEWRKRQRKAYDFLRSRINLSDIPGIHLVKLLASWSYSLFTKLYFFIKLGSLLLSF